ncbi:MULTISPECIES: hypothetical protein [unclassified Kitasatospora]|uniref:hypothetical protein n=1 Tax=unclassified Kitasatospora TaxID=2633591 RepID=UPI00070D3FB3|nr:MULTISPECIES: hypothetical protein [unclassified Kitasatospora]KQV10938.1 hypothetical protein ASC99_36200 [Kitasatospora sp. Root107]KRB72628.1 hypothetical protein ASE03_22640 [Kitasatospora sp. Root187]
MSKKRATTLAEMVTALGPAPAEQSGGRYLQSPVQERGFTDAAGCHWRLVRGPLDPRRAKRLAVEAAVMSMGDHYDEEAETWFPRFLPEHERPAAWLAARAWFDATDLLVHEAYEFVADDGRALLHIETYC